MTVAKDFSSAFAPTSEPSLIANPPNARRTTEALRELGYDSYDSVLDLIDNCIDAQASVVDVTVSERKGDILISIDDDGIGMDAETLSEALKLGSETDRETGDLGKFGLGLVTASIGLSKRVEIFTREENGEIWYGGFDLDDIANRGEFVKWVAEGIGYAPIDFDKPHGTRVCLSKTDRISNRRATEFANVLRKRIGQVYRKFLKASLHINVNGKSVDPIDPLMLTDPKTRVMLEMDLGDDEGLNASLRVVELPDYGQAGNRDLGIIPQNSGFYVLRNNREIMEAQTFDFYKKHPDYSHFRAELSFDGRMDTIFHTDVKKTSINPSQSFLDKLRQATAALIKEAGREGRARANGARGQIDHSIAEGNITRRATLIPKPKALIEKRTSRGKSGLHTRGNGERTRTPHVTDLQTVSGLKVVFEEGDYNEGPFYFVKQEGRTIVITYNREHPFWRELIEHSTEPKVVATLDYLVFALANAELLVPEPARVVKESVNVTLVGLLV